MNFTAIDFETAHAQFPCELGLSVVRNGVVVASDSWLIKPVCFPYMNPWNERVHGISTAMLANENSFEHLWSKISNYFSDEILVAHNASFDMGILRAMFLHYDLALPNINYFCSLQLARKAWKNLPSHGLGALSQYHSIQFKHHRAGDDATACALITVKALSEFSTCSFEDAFTLSGVKLKRFLI